MLKIVVLPAVVNISRSTVGTIPRDCCRNTLTLKTAGREDIFGAVLPTSGSNILTKIILNVNETLNRAVTIMLVTNGRIRVPRDIASKLHALATGVILRVNCSANLRHRTLVTANIILFMFILLVALSVRTVGDEDRGHNWRQWRGGQYHFN